MNVMAWILLWIGSGLIASVLLLWWLQHENSQGDKGEDVFVSVLLGWISGPIGLFVMCGVWMAGLVADGLAGRAQKNTQEVS